MNAPLRSALLTGFFALAVISTMTACTRTNPSRSVAPPTTLTLAVRPKTVETGPPLSLQSGGRTVFAYPPADASVPRPAAVYLNGLCGVPTNGCPHFHEGVASVGWLVCPSANAACPAGGASWSGSASTKREIVEQAVDLVGRAFPGQLDAANRTVLIGFSQGARVALDIVHLEPSKYRALLLIGAFVEPTAAELRRVGVSRIVFAAGALDQSAASMSRTAAALARAGVHARFVSLGRVGHTYVADEAHRTALTSALEWLEDWRSDSEPAAPGRDRG